MTAIVFISEFLRLVFANHTAVLMEFICLTQLEVTNKMDSEWGRVVGAPPSLAGSNLRIAFLVAINPVVLLVPLTITQKERVITKSETN